MSTWKRVLKYFLHGILALIICLLVFVGMLYIPGVQRFVKGKVERYVTREMGLRLEIGHFELRFPLALKVERIYLGNGEQDTLLAANLIRLDMDVWRLTHQEIDVRQLDVRKVYLQLSDSISGFRLQTRVAQLGLENSILDLSGKTIRVSKLLLDEGRVLFTAGHASREESAPADSSDVQWQFVLHELALRRVDCEVNGLAMGNMQVGVEKLVVDSGRVDLASQKIHVDQFLFQQGYCVLERKGAEDLSAGETDEADSIPWTVQAGKVAVRDSRFLMYPQFAVEASFPEVIELSELTVEVDSVYNRGTEVEALVRDVQFKERGGLNVEQLSCWLKLKEKTMEVPDLQLKTSNSQIQLKLKMGSGLTDFSNRTSMELLMDGYVAGKDWVAYIPNAGEKYITLLGQEVFNLQVNLNGSLEDLRLKQMEIASTNCSFVGNGELLHIADSMLRNGQLHFDLSVRDGRIFDVFLPRDSSTPIFVIPDFLNVKGDLTLAGQKVESQLMLRPEKGSFQLTAVYDGANASYRTDIRCDSLDLGSFLPRDSLGELSMHITANGEGIHWETMRGELNVAIESLQYRGYEYAHLTCKAGLADGQMDGELHSSMEALDLDVLFRLSMQANDYQGMLSGDVRRIDLRALHLLQEEFAFDMNFRMDGIWAERGVSKLQMDLSSLFLEQYGVRQKLGDWQLRARGDSLTTTVDMHAGDFSLHFGSEENSRLLWQKLMQAWTSLEEQVLERRLNIDSLQAALPEVALQVEAKKENLFSRYLQRNRVYFEHLDLQLATREKLRLDTRLSGLVVKDLTADSLIIGVRQEGAALLYAVNLLNARDSSEHFSRFYAGGKVEQDQFNLRAMERNASGKSAFNVGLAFTMQDSSIMMQVLPDSLILGYEPWRVNADNYLKLDFGEMLYANLALENGEKKVALFSGEDFRRGTKSLDVDVQGLDLGVLSGIFTFLPEMSGILTVDLRLFDVKDVVDMGGKITLDEFCYQKQRIGNLELWSKYLLTREQKHEVDFALHLDGDKMVLAEGELTTSSDHKGMMLDMDIPKFPLYVANAFMAPDLLRLTGFLNGKVAVRGNLEQPMINGGLAIQDGNVDVLAMGTRFGVDSNQVVIKNNHLQFKGFGLIAPNKQRMELTGGIDLSALQVDASVRANNFQVLKAKQNDSTMVYGKAYVNLNTRVRGPLDALTVRGNISLLDNSEINYPLRSSPLEATDKSENMVRFVSFRDTVLMEQDDRLTYIPATSMDVLLQLNIAPLVNLNVLLSDNGQNRVSINGGGSLTYTLNPLGDSRLMGKYVLTGGTVNYSIPVMGEKVFTIQDGNYVEWTGNLMNPLLNIKASEMISASVTDDSQNSRLVNFQAIIQITNTLERPDITFDLAAEGDMNIQNQLAGMTPEERSKEAMNLMIYGAYSGPGTVAKSNASANALNGLIEKELNQWSRKYLKGMDLSFGINTYNETTGSGETQKTDYSYQLSKRLFNNKVRVKVGGRISTDHDPTAGGVEENLIDDIAVEYVFGKNPNFFLKLFRHTGYESVLEGEVTQTGIGVVFRKKFQKFLDIFRGRKKLEQRRLQTTKVETR